MGADDFWHTDCIDLPSTQPLPLRSMRFGITQLLTSLGGMTQPPEESTQRQKIQQASQGLLFFWAQIHCSQSLLEVEPDLAAGVSHLIIPALSSMDFQSVPS